MWRRLNLFFHRDLWRAEPASRAGRVIYRVLRVLVVMGQELAGGQLTLRAMSLVYTTLLSLVPLLAVSFSVLKAFGVHNQLEPLLLQYLEPLGSRGAEVARHILTFVDNMKVGVLGSVGVGLLLYTVISLTQKVESAFNYVWRVRRTRNLARRFSDYMSVIMVGPVLVFSAIGLTASLLDSRLVHALLAVPGLGMLIIVVGKVIPFLLIIGAFTFIYMFVPNTRVRFRSALLGALVSGVLWETTGLLFASFVASSSRYTAIYSGFAILIFFMIWLYLSWFILLFGAELSYFHQHPHQIRPQRERYRLSNRIKERAGLTLLYLVADAFYHNHPPFTLDLLIRRLGLPGDNVTELLQQLVQHGYLVETGDDLPAYLPAHDPAQVPLSEVLTVLRSAEESTQLVPAALLAVEPVTHVAQRLEQAVETAFTGMTLKDLADNDSDPGAGEG